MGTVLGFFAALAVPAEAAAGPSPPRPRTLQVRIETVPVPDPPSPKPVTLRLAPTPVPAPPPTSRLVGAVEVVPAPPPPAPGSVTVAVQAPGLPDPAEPRPVAVLVEPLAPVAASAPRRVDVSIDATLGFPPGQARPVRVEIEAPEPPPLPSPGIVSVRLGGRATPPPPEPRPLPLHVATTPIPAPPPPQVVPVVIEVSPDFDPLLEALRRIDAESARELTSAEVGIGEAAVSLDAIDADLDAIEAEIDALGSDGRGTGGDFLVAGALIEEIALQRGRARAAADEADVRVRAVCSAAARSHSTLTAGDLAAIDRAAAATEERAQVAAEAARAARRALETLRREGARGGGAKPSSAPSPPIAALLERARDAMGRTADIRADLVPTRTGIDRLADLDRESEELCERIDQILAPAEAVGEGATLPGSSLAPAWEGAVRSEVRALRERIDLRPSTGRELLAEAADSEGEVASRARRLVERLETLDVGPAPGSGEVASAAAAIDVDAAEGAALEASASLDRLARCRIDLESLRERARTSETRSEPVTEPGDEPDPAPPAGPAGPQGDRWTRGSRETGEPTGSSGEVDDDWVRGARRERDDPCRGPRPEYAAGLARVEAAAASRDLEALTAAVADLPVGCPGDAERLARLRDAAVAVARAEAHHNETRMRSELGRAQANAWASAAAALAEATRALSRGADAARPGTGSGAVTGPSGGCRIVPSDPEGPRAFNFDYQYWIEESSLGGTPAFKVQRMLYDDEAPPSAPGRTFHGPYTSRDEAEGALDRLCPRSRRSSG